MRLERLPVVARIPLARRWGGPTAVLALIALLIAGGLARSGSSKLLFAPGEDIVFQAHGTWSRMFDAGSFATRHPLTFWVVALLVVGVIGLPYVWVATASLADRGFALARPVGLLLVGWLVWWLASLRLVSFTRGGIALSMAIVAAGGAAIVVPRRREFFEWLKHRRRLLIAEEAIFWSLFAAAALVRFANPDLWHPSLGGEKPMDLAYLNAVVKSDHFPPYDPWFAGGQMNYYYFGFVLIAVLVKMTSVAPYVAYNLAVPTLFAFLGAAAFSATLALVGSRGRRLGQLATAVLGTLLVAVLGNLGEIRVLRDAIWERIPIDWWYWNPSRLIHHPLSEPGPINEFPAFTYLYGDLHAHAMALPYTAVALTLALAFVRDTGSQRAFGVTARLMLLALVLGSLSVLNTWDLPVYSLLALLGLAVYTFRRGFSASSAVTLAARCGALLALAYAFFLPFHRRYAGVFSGVDIWHGSRTRLNDYLTMHGVFLFAIASALVVELWVSREVSAVARGYRLGLRSWHRIGRFRELHRLIVRGSPGYAVGVRAVPAVALGVVVLAALGQGVAALVAALTGATLLCLVTRRGRLLWQATLVLALLGLAITLAVEYFVAKNIDVGRNNTVFKFYLQAWVLWALASAVCVHRVYERLPAFGRWVRGAWRLAFVAVLATAALYPILATRAKIGDRFDKSVGATFDGSAFMRKAVHHDKDRDIPLVYDADAIRWVLENVTGSPVVGEINTAPTLYGWGNRYAMFTGNPAIIGWDYHQRQQRGPENHPVVNQRVADVQSAYRTTDPRRAYRLFRRYGVSFFVVGPLERAYFPAGQDKWRAGEGSLWRVVYRNPGVSIYRLVRP